MSNCHGFDIWVAYIHHLKEVVLRYDMIKYTLIVIRVVRHPITINEGSIFGRNSMYPL